VVLLWVRVWGGFAVAAAKCAASQGQGILVLLFKLFLVLIPII
jgi:hypothetical protein